jgi:enoyl-CoA hydratase/carnithine racemase
MTYEHIEVLRDGHITRVNFNRPDKANALNYAHLQEVEAVALGFRDDAETRAIIFTGNGKHFSSGADLTDPGAAYQVPLVHRRRRMRMGERAIEAILNIDQITIAAWNGAAMGGGACVATACDFRVGANDCFMQYPEIDIGVNLMWKSLPLIVNLVGPARAKRLVVGGERIHADTLLAWGVLDELVHREKLLDHATTMAEHYASKPPVAAQMIKQSTNNIANALNHAIMHMDADQNLFGAGTEDRKEAIRSYLDKTKPTFTGN